MSEPSRPDRHAHALAVVLQTRAVTPRMRRITLGGEGIVALLQADGVDAPAAWVKLFLPTGEGRAYTVRSLNRRAGTVDIDFVLHGDAGDGPASRWAAQARPGEFLGIAGPRNGGFAPPADTQSLLVIGDATALPAIQSIAAQLAQTWKVEAYVEVANDDERQAIETTAVWHTEWITALSGNSGLRLCQAVRHHPMSADVGYIWMAGEAWSVRELKQHFLERGFERQRLSAKGYWKRGESDHRG